MRLARHLPSLLLASTLPLAAACEGDGDDGDDGGIDQSGTDHTYVVSRVDVPSNGSEATALGLDIDDLENDPNMGIDNQLGTVLDNLGPLAPSLDVQSAIDGQVDEGGIILLVKVKAKDLASASGVGLWIFPGDDPKPAPCADATDKVCRKHLAGGAMFGLDASWPTDASLGGKIVAGKFTGGPGTVTLRIALSQGVPIDLPLQMAKAELTGISPDGFCEPFRAARTGRQRV